MRLSENSPAHFWGKVWDADLGELNPGKAFGLRILRIAYVVARELSGGYLALRARALVYSTLLSLVPLLAVSFSVMKGLNVHARFEIFLYYLLEPLGEKGVDLSMQIISFVENTRAGVLGTVGLVFLLYTGISQLNRLEEGLNATWHSRGNGPFARRLARYLSVLVLGPLAVAVAAGFAASFADLTTVRYLSENTALAALLPVLSRIVFAASVCGVFALVYIIFPNTRVQLVPALSGGLFAGSAWLLTGWIFARFIATSARYSVIYSGFAALILFLIWMYWSFLILLIGCRVAFYTQYPGIHLVRVEGTPLGPALQERLALQLMFLIARNFHDGRKPLSGAVLARQLRVPSEAVEDVLVLLEHSGFIAPTTGTESGTYLPARDIELVTVREVLEAARKTTAGSYAFSRTPVLLDEVETVLKGAEDAVSHKLSTTTLRDLLRKPTDY